MNVWIILFWKWYKSVCKTYAVKFVRPLALLMWISHITTGEQWIYIGQNGQTPLFLKVFCNLPLFLKYLKIYHIFETQFCVNWVFNVTFKIFSWCSSSMNSSFIKNFQNFFVVLKFHELKYHWKLDFHKIEFQKGGRLLNILQTVVDYTYSPK